jgi:hypothetical protein
VDVTNQELTDFIPQLGELRLQNPPTSLDTGKLTVTVRDRQGNTARIERSFSVAAKGPQ